MHALWFGFLLGLGAAIPLGPVNLEIIRRNIHYGFASGTLTGAGACLADLVYLLLLSCGFLTLLSHPLVMKIIGFAGSLILAWFGLSALKTSARSPSGKLPRTHSLLRQGFQGLSMTMLNPFTILFWASVSSQISSLSTGEQSLVMAGTGVILGTFGWVLFLNITLHFTRHFFGARFSRLLNWTGGLILLGFAVTGIIRTCLS